MEGSFSIHHFLVAFLTLFTFVSSLNLALAASASPEKINTAFIKTSCSATNYPRLCFTSLSSHANAIGDDPKLLARAALSIALDAARSTSTMMVTLSKSHGMKPREVAAMRDCLEELGDSVDQMRQSLGEMKQMKGSHFDLIVNDIQTWVSAALTDDDTCMEGFAGHALNGSMKNVVRGRISKVAHLTSNALALIDGYVATQG